MISSHLTSLTLSPKDLIKTLKRDSVKGLPCLPVCSIGRKGFDPGNSRTMYTGTLCKIRIELDYSKLVIQHQSARSILDQTSSQWLLPSRYKTISQRSILDPTWRHDSPGPLAQHVASPRKIIAQKTYAYGFSTLDDLKIRRPYQSVVQTRGGNSSILITSKRSKSPQLIARTISQCFGFSWALETSSSGTLPKLLSSR